ncbi:MAG: hypothetical protein ACFHWX_18770 [Bacteroidota bacterium]
MGNYQQFDENNEEVQVIDRLSKIIYANNSLAKKVNLRIRDLCGGSVIDTLPGFLSSSIYQHILECIKDHSSFYLLQKFNYQNEVPRSYEFFINPVEDGALVISRELETNKA